MLTFKSLVVPYRSGRSGSSNRSHGSGSSRSLRKVAAAAAAVVVVVVVLVATQIVSTVCVFCSLCGSSRCCELRSNVHSPVCPATSVQKVLGKMRGDRQRPISRRPQQEQSKSHQLTSKQLGISRHSVIVVVVAVVVVM